MKRFLMILALVALATPRMARAADWTEIETSLWERIDGKIAPNLGVGYLHYINDRAVGVTYSGPDDAGASTSWRVYERGWQNGWTLAFHVIASTNLLDGDFNNDVTGGVEARIGWPEIGLLKQIQGHGDGEILLRVGQFKFQDGSQPEYALAFGIAWWPAGRNQ